MGVRNDMQGALPGVGRGPALGLVCLAPALLRRPHSRLVLRWMRRGSAAGRLAATRRPDNHEPARAMLVRLVGHPGDRRAGHLGHLILLPPDRRP